MLVELQKIAVKASRTERRIIKTLFIDSPPPLKS